MAPFFFCLRKICNVCNRDIYNTEAGGGDIQGPPFKLTSLMELVS